MAAEFRPVAPADPMNLRPMLFLEQDTVSRALEHQPHAVMLSFGDARPLAEPVRAARAVLIIQVTTLDEARQAVDLGADLPPAADVVADLAAQAEDALTQALGR